MKKSGFLFLLLISFNHLFSQNLSPQKDSITNMFGYRNEYNTKWSIKPSFDSAEDFSGGVAIISMKQMYGLINKKGEFIVSPQLEELSGEKYFIFKKDNQKGIMNAKGKILLSGEYDHIYYEPARGDAMLMKDNLYGYWDTTGSFIPPLSKYELGFNSNVAYFNSGKTQGFVNRKGEKIIEEGEGDIWDIIPYGFISKKGKKDCLFDMTGKMIGQCDFDTIIQLRKDFILFYKDHKYGIINYKGESVLPEEYAYISPFNEQGIAVVKKDKLYGLMNENFEIVMPLDNEEIENFGNDYNRFYGKYKNYYNFSIYKKKDHFGVINDSGRVVIEPQYDMAMIDGNSFLKFIHKDKLGLHDLRRMEKLPLSKSFDFINDKTIFCIKSSNGIRCGVARKDGKIIVMPVYKSITSTVNGYAIVNNHEGAGIIDSSGKLIVPLVYSDIKTLDDVYKKYFHHTGDFVWDGFLYVRTKNEKIGVTKENGRLVIDTSYSNVTAYDPECDCWFVKTNKGAWNIISQARKKYSVHLDTPSTYDESGIALVKKNNLYGLINVKGKTIFPINYKNVVLQSNGLFYYLADSLWGIADHKGKVVSKPGYKHIFPYMNGFAFAHSGNDWGLIDSAGNYTPGYGMFLKMKDAYNVVDVNSVKTLEFGYSNNGEEGDEIFFQLLTDHQNKTMLNKANDLILAKIKNISNHQYSLAGTIMYPQNFDENFISGLYSGKGVEILNVTDNTITINNFTEEGAKGILTRMDIYEVFFIDNGRLNKINIKDLLKTETDTIKLKELLTTELEASEGKKSDEINLTDHLNFEISDEGLVFRLSDLTGKKSGEKETTIVLTYAEIRAFVKSDGVLKEFY
jgi:hypothetical protein